MKRSGEQLSGNLESKKHGDRYEVFRRYAKMVNAIMEHCIEIKGRTFEDVEDMEDATYTIASRWGDELQSYQKSAGDIPIRASGEGIHVPHVNLQSITGEQNVGVLVGIEGEASEGMLHTLPMFENKTGYIQALLAKPEYDEKMNTYSTSFHFLVRDKAVAQLSFTDPKSGMPLVTARLQRYFLADCSEHTEIEFPATEHVDARNQSIEALAQCGIKRNRFISEIQKVSAAFYNHESDEEDFLDMKSVDRLRWIARKAEQLTADGACSPDVKSNALLSMFGKHQLFEIEGTRAKVGMQSDTDMEIFPMESEMCDGTIEDVFMYADDTNRMTPVLAFVDSLDKTNEMKYFLLREVRSIRF
jgi:hypothetical protein